MNSAKKKGTEGENEIVSELLGIWPTTERTAANTPACDITGTPLDAIEVKRRAKWMVKSWAFEQVKRHHRDRWAIFMMDGDRRLSGSAPDVVTFPREFGLELLACWEANGRPVRAPG